MAEAKAQPYEIEILHDFRGTPLDKISFEYNPNQSVHIRNVVQNLGVFSERDSMDFLDMYNKANPALGNSEVAFLTGVLFSHGDYKIQASRGDYKMVYALRDFVKSYSRKRSSVDYVYSHVTPVGMGTFTTTKDGKFLVSRRSDKVDVPNSLITYWVGNWDAEGRETMPGFFDRLENRASVKVGLNRGDYELRSPLGVYRDKQASHNPVVAFSARLPDLTADQAKERLKAAQSASRFSDKDVIAVDIDEKISRKFLVENVPYQVGNGTIVELMGLSEILGGSWFEETMEEMKGVFHTSENYKFYDETY
jgi:hypothetical protein